MSLWMWTRRIFFDRTPRWALLELFVMDPLFLTTAIDYANAQPHLGHAYEKVLTDTLARFARQSTHAPCRDDSPVGRLLWSRDREDD